MARGKLAILLLFLLVLAGAVCFGLLSRPGNEAHAPSPPAGAVRGEFRGICLQVQSGYEGHPFESYIDQIAATGANTVSLVLAAHQEHAGSTSIFMDVEKTPSDSHLRRLINHAHSRGLRVSIMPIVLLENPRTAAEWRGKLAPSDWDRWWKSYTRIAMRYAQLAAEEKVEVFIIGSELNSSEQFPDRWRHLIRRVREVYKGLLAYSSNWDHFKQVPFWDELDLVGLNCYYDLTGGRKPSMPILMESWERIKKDILDFQAKVNRPLLFTEVGWPSQETGAQAPWDYTRSTDRPDLALQALCFEAFFKAWGDEPAVAGFYIWEWQNYPSQLQDEGEGSYLLKKPAMDVIKAFFARKNAAAAQAEPDGPQERLPERGD